MPYSWELNKRVYPLIRHIRVNVFVDILNCKWHENSINLIATRLKVLIKCSACFVTLNLMYILPSMQTYVVFSHTLLYTILHI